MIDDATKNFILKLLGDQPCNDPARMLALRLSKHNYNHSDKNTANRKRYNDSKRAKIISLLGGKCVKCGFDNPLALQVDHVNGDGHDERKILSAGPYKLLELVVKDIRDGTNRYQLLCANCNQIKKFEQKEYGYNIER